MAARQNARPPIVDVEHFEAGAVIVDASRRDGGGTHYEIPVFAPRAVYDRFVLAACAAPAALRRHAARIRSCYRRFRCVSRVSDSCVSDHVKAEDLRLTPVA